MEKQTGQTYDCLHCGQRHQTIFGLLLHIYTGHLGSNIVLEPGTAKEFLKDTQRFTLGREVVVWEN